MGHDGQEGVLLDFQAFLWLRMVLIQPASCMRAPIALAEYSIPNVHFEVR